MMMPDLSFRTRITLNHLGTGVLETESDIGMVNILPPCGIAEAKRGNPFMHSISGTDTFTALCRHAVEAIQGFQVGKAVRGLD